MHTLSKKPRSDVALMYSVYSATTKMEMNVHFAYITAAANCGPFSSWFICTIKNHMLAPCFIMLSNRQKRIQKIQECDSLRYYATFNF